MATADIITQELVRSLAPNPAAVSNAQKISRSGGFASLNISEDKTLIFGECKGSGKNPYVTSADFSGETPVFRCSCPSRQFPCKHSLAIMLDYLAGKNFTKAEIPADVASKREKLAKKAEKAEAPAPKKQNKAAAAKKLKKQAEGLDLAESFVKDVMTRGVSSINSTSAAQYHGLAKQLGDYYLPEPQTIVREIVAAAETLSETPDDAETDRLVRLCVKLYSTVKKSREYINSKLESGEVLPEDSILYEAMGGVWKLSQLKEIGLYKENARIIQLSFSVLTDEAHEMYVDTGYWVDLDTGEISRTENKRPFRAAKHIAAQDSAFGVYAIKELYRYPGGLNRRIRWESAEVSDAGSDAFEQIVSRAEPTVSDAVKKAKNELKNTLSDERAAVLVPFDEIGFTTEGSPVLSRGEETLALRPLPDYPKTCGVLKLCGVSGGGALLGEMFYDPAERRLFLCPLSVVTRGGITRLI